MASRFDIAKGIYPVIYDPTTDPDYVSAIYEVGGFVFDLSKLIRIDDIIYHSNVEKYYFQILFIEKDAHITLYGDKNGPIENLRKIRKDLIMTWKKYKDFSFKFLMNLDIKSNLDPS